MINLLKKIWSQPKQRNILILSLLIIILLIIIVYQVMNVQMPPPPGSLRVVVCTKCKEQYIERIVDISNTEKICRKCEGPLSYAWKCKECKFEYPELLINPKNPINTSTMEIFQKVVESQRCPNCSCTDTCPISIDELKNKK